MRLAAGSVVCTLITGLLSAMSPLVTPAGAAGLAISTYRDVLVDEAHNRVFVTGGALVTTDLVGTPTGAVAGITSGRQMSLTPDGNQLLVANGDGISVVDTATATLVRTITTGPNSCPGALAPAGGLIFFSYGACTGGTPGLGAVDLADDTITLGIATGSVAVEPDRDFTGQYSWEPVLLAPIPGSPNAMVLTAGSTLAVFDVTMSEGPTVSVRASRQMAGVPLDLAVNAAGTEVVTGGSALGAYALTDLSPVRSYGVDDPHAMDFRADGRLAVAPGANGGVGIYAPGSSVRAYSVALSTERVNTQTRGLAYGAVRLYAVIRSIETQAYRVVVAPVGPPANLTLTTDKSAYNYKATAVVTIKLSSPTISRTVSLYARPYGRDLRLVKTAAVGASSRTLVVKVPYLTYNTTFLAKFAGDSAFAPASAIRAVKVRAKLVITSSATSVVNGYHRLNNSPSPTLLFTVYPRHPNQCLRISGSLLVNGSWRALSGGQFSECVRTNSNSKFALKLVGFRAGDRLRVSGIYSNGGTSGPIYPGGEGNIDSLPVSYLVYFY